MPPEMRAEVWVRGDTFARIAERWPRAALSDPNYPSVLHVLEAETQAELDAMCEQVRAALKRGESPPDFPSPALHVPVPPPPRSPGRAEQVRDTDLRDPLPRLGAPVAVK